MRTSTIKSIAALALTGAGSALVLGFKTTGGAATLPVANSGSATSSSSGAASSSGSSSTSGSASTSGSGATSNSGSSSGSSGSTAKYTDGTWTGTEVSEPWGPFQVQVVISGGKITNVRVVESPGDRHSSRINNVAVPLLTESTMATQSPTADMVSGATWTSESYATSLQAALDKAAQAS
jgi:uncharacterized protein with FMN-binding domain